MNVRETPLALKEFETLCDSVVRRVSTCWRTKLPDVPLPVRFSLDSKYFLRPVSNRTKRLRSDKTPYDPRYMIPREEVTETESRVGRTELGKRTSASSGVRKPVAINVMLNCTKQRHSQGEGIEKNQARRPTQARTCSKRIEIEGTWLRFGSQQ